MTTAERPELTTDSPTAVVNCANRWNASIERDQDDLSERISQVLRASDDVKASVALYRGPKVADRRGRCLVLISPGPVTLPPYSPTRKGGRWGTVCRLVSAEIRPKSPKRCSAYQRSPGYAAELRRNGALKFE